MSHQIKSASRWMEDHDRVVGSLRIGNRNFIVTLFGCFFEVEWEAENTLRIKHQNLMVQNGKA